MEFLKLIAISILTKYALDAVKAMIPALKQLDAKYKQVAIFYILGFGVSLLLAFGMKADIFQMLGIEFSIKYVGIIITALIASGGSKVVHDFINKYKENITNE